MIGGLGVPAQHFSYLKVNKYLFAYLFNSKTTVLLNIRMRMRAAYRKLSAKFTVEKFVRQNRVLRNFLKGGRTLFKNITLNFATFLFQIGAKQSQDGPNSGTK